MGLVVEAESTLTSLSPTVAGTATVDLITDNGVQVLDNGNPVYLFAANGATTVAVPVVASPVVIVAGGNVVTYVAEV